MSRKRLAIQKESGDSSYCPNMFPLLCGVDIYYETPPFSPGLGVLPGQLSLRQVVSDAIQPPPLWYSSPSIPRHLHRHQSIAYVFVFSSQYMPIPLLPTFVHFLGYLSNLRCPSNYFILNSVQLSDSTHPSQHPHFRHIQLILLCFLHCPILGTVHHCWSYNCIVYFPLDSQTYSSVAQNPRYPLPVFPS